MQRYRSPKLRQERHVYRDDAIEGPSSSGGAACFLVPGRSVRLSPTESCRSYGAWPSLGAVVAINMALLTELWYVRVREKS